MKSLYGITARFRFWNVSFQPTSKSELFQLFSFQIICLGQLLLNSATFIRNVFQPEDRSLNSGRAVKILIY